MAEKEFKFVSNMTEDDVYRPTEQSSADGGVVTLAPLAEQWEEQGILFELRDPVETEAYSSDQLGAMGMKGVYLSVEPVAEQ